jgi:hypothetical protein
MDELMDMITSDESPSQISDKIKDLLFAKAAERVDSFKPVASNSLFGEDEFETEVEVEDTEEYEES